MYYLTSLKPCMVYKLSVTPVFNYMSAKLRGLGKNTQSTITGEESKESKGGKGGREMGGGTFESVIPHSFPLPH